METKRTHEELTEILDRITFWIENCDSKTSILLGGFGVIFGIILANENALKIIKIYRIALMNINFLMLIYLILNALSLGLIISGCLCWITVLFARVDMNEFADRGIKKDSLVFFESIANYKSLNSYKKKLIKCDEKQMDDDLISQIYICSIICQKKFKYYKLGLVLVLVGVTLWMLLIIFWLLFL